MANSILICRIDDRVCQKYDDRAQKILPLMVARIQPLLNETHSDARAVHADDFTAPFDIILVGSEGAGHDNIAPDAKAALDLNIGAAGT